MNKLKPACKHTMGVGDCGVRGCPNNPHKPHPSEPDPRSPEPSDEVNDVRGLLKNASTIFHRHSEAARLINKALERLEGVVGFVGIPDKKPKPTDNFEKLSAEVEEVRDMVKVVRDRAFAMNDQSTSERMRLMLKALEGVVGFIRKP